MDEEYIRDTAPAGAEFYIKFDIFRIRYYFRIEQERYGFLWLKKRPVIKVWNGHMHKFIPVQKHNMTVDVLDLIPLH
ncbi:hypothetical protein ABFK62_15345 [Acinetobacter baumannii]|uniref:hypothetical protein n=1 Tax=Acinetobacter baumannii TaxID=470 RepID=UPI0007431F14|nr:hypothetical protein [Acinetobacter baumannii]